MIVFRPYRAILFLTIFIPFQETIILWLPVQDSIHIWLRFLPEFILYFIFSLVILNKIFLQKPLKKTPIDLLVIAFVGLSVIAMLWNKSFTIISVINLRVLLRYLTIYYLVVNIPISRKQTSTLLTIIMVIGLLQGILALGQFISNDFNQIFVLKSINSEIMGVTKTFAVAKVGAVSGTFPNVFEMTYFLLIALIIILTYGFLKTNRYIPDPKYLFALIIIIWGIFATFKRAALLGIPFLLIAVLYFGEKRKQIKLVIMASTALFILFMTSFFLSVWSFDFTQDYEILNSHRQSFSLKTYFSQPFTAGYWDHLLYNQRIRFISDVSGAMIREANFIGYGPDEQKAQKLLVSLDPIKFEKFGRDFKGFEDVYWVVMFIYYGAFGLAIFLFALYRLYITSRWLSKNSLYEEYHILGTVFSTLIILVLIFSFIDQILEFRVFGFYFWLLAGLVVNAYYVQRQQLQSQRNLVP